MIELAAVTKRYDTADGRGFTAVAAVDLVVERGRITVLKGPSGSGKTTLLALVGCMSRPTAGRITLRAVPPGFDGIEDRAGLEVSSLSERFLTRVRRSTFGFVFQHFGLVKGVSALENVMLPAYPTGRQRAEIRERALGLLELFGILRHATMAVDRLSGGELQRVAIARALVNDPAAIVADEPTAHLDSRLSGEFMEIVGALRGEGKTVLIASHDPIVHDSAFADIVVEMRDGHVVGTQRRR